MCNHPELAGPFRQVLIHLSINPTLDVQKNCQISQKHTQRVINKQDSKSAKEKIREFVQITLILGDFSWNYFSYDLLSYGHW